ncbi:GNAT family protein [Castellaniella caeni]
MTTPSVLNPLGQPIGLPLGGWQPPAPPSHEPMEGRFCRVEALDPARHAEALFAEYAHDRTGRQWTYLSYGPFESLQAYQAWLAPAGQSRDPLFFVIVRKADARPVGVASYLRITPQSGCLEVGHLSFSDALKHTPVATEAMALMMQRAFALGYRRYEWKCDALNAASHAAARRLGFRYEGLFRQATVYKGRSRDTAWYSVIDSEWPRLRQAYAQWLAPENFTPDGRQRTRLSELTHAPGP